LAAKHQVRSIAFPAISCGIYGYPVADACQIAVGETMAYLDANDLPESVTFVCFGRQIYGAYRAALDVSP
jgi:O-acetyl-ADP-ribose deacetylase